MKDRLNIKGVNLGNWLVLEKWMNPAMFEGVPAEDEYYLAMDLDAARYAERIRMHRKEYITRRDFAAIAAMGFNSVRIPVPYFIFGDRPPFIGCIEELDDAFDWAEEFGLKILIDLHAVPFSQNAFDNGGLCGVCKWAQMPEEVEFVLNLLEKLAERYGKRAGLFGIQPLNEPLTTLLFKDVKLDQLISAGTYRARDHEMAKGSAPIKFDFLKKFYLDAYDRIMKHMDADKYFVFNDAFDMTVWKDFMQDGKHENVVLDTHIYIHGVERQAGISKPEEYVKAWEKFGNDIEEMRNYFHVICGEFCLSCSYADNMPDGPERAEAYRWVAKQQIDTWNRGDGYYFWSYKLNPGKSGLESWDMGDCMLRGWINGQLL